MIGAGAWGTALAIQAARAGNSVMLWARDPARAAVLAETRENPRLPGMKLPDAVEVTATLTPSPLGGREKVCPTPFSWRCRCSTYAAC